jgi:hypothetical protein
MLNKGWRVSSGSDSRTAWNEMQGGPSCEEDPALPVFLTLTSPLEKVACDFFQ